MIKRYYTISGRFLLKYSLFPLLFFIMNMGELLSSDSISLGYCYFLLEKNYPLTSQYELNQRITDIKKKKNASTWYPGVEFNASATHQSDVFEIDVDIPLLTIDLPKGPADQIKFNLDITQQLYDGGYSQAMKQLIQANHSQEQQKITVDINNLKEIVNDLYFSVLLYQENIAISTLLHQELQERLKTAQSLYKNGTITESDVHILQAEIYKIEQLKSGLEIQKQSAIESISSLLDTIFTAETYFSEPAIDIIQGNDSLQRPEKLLFSYQKDMLTANQQVLKTTTRPRFFVFTQLGYGKPGLKMLYDEFDSYYIIGAGIRWNLWDWNQTRREQQIIELQKNIIDSKEKAFDKNMMLKINNSRSLVNKYLMYLEHDMKIIDLKKKITQAATSKYENGVITATDYLMEKNAESQSELNYSTHKLLLLKAKIDYLILMGWL